MTPNVPPPISTVRMMPDYEEKYRLRRGLLLWAVECWGFHYDDMQISWKPIKRYWRKNNAVLHLVKLALDGEQVEL